MTILVAKIAWLVLAGGWYGLRIPHERRSRKTQISRNEMGWPEKQRLAISLTGLGIIPFLYVATGFPKFANYTFQPLLCLAGIVMVAVALVLFHLTHKALGRNWSVTLQLREKHELITHGVYKYVRHPMYTAFWAWALAQALLLPNWVAGFSGIIGFGTLYLLRVGPEEKLMLDEFGEDYRSYMDRTGRLLPKFRS